MRYKSPESRRSVREPGLALRFAPELLSPSGPNCKLSKPSPARPALDISVSELFLDALAPLQAAIASAAARVPYIAVRGVMDVDEESRGEVVRAFEAVVAKHAGFFAEHRSAIEFTGPLMALNAAKVDHLLVLAGASQAEAGQPLQPCSMAETFAIGCIVLAPLALLALILILGWRMK